MPRTLPRPVSVVLALSALASVATGQDEGALGPPIPVAPEWLALEAELILESSSVLRGGVRRRTSNARLLTLGAEADLDEALDTEGAGTITLGYATATPVSGGSQDIGDVQIASNIETDRSLDHILELAWRSDFGGPVEVLFGKIDANDEFAAPPSAGTFAHSSAGFTPSIFTFPSYPEPATAACLFLEQDLQEGVSLRLAYGLFDGALGADGVSTGRRGPSSFFRSRPSNDLFHIAQADLTVDDVLFAAGAWFHDGRFETFDGGEDVGTAGTYFLVDGPLAPGWRGFAQAGFADRDLTEFGAHYAAGVVGPGPREDDEWGFYWSHVDLVSAAAPSDEWTLDLYGRFQTTESVAVQPEFMWTVDPGGRTDISDASVILMRLILSL